VEYAKYAKYAKRWDRRDFLIKLEEMLRLFANVQKK
jgi:hypothetical protein